MKIQMLVFIVAYIIGLISSSIVLPVLKKYKMGQVVRDDGPKSHLKKAGTPTMGGMAILITVLLVLFVYAFKYPLLVLPIIAFLGFGLIGFIDDFKKLRYENTEGLSPIKKIILLFVVSTIFIAVYLYVFKLDTDMIVPLYDQYVNMSTDLFVLFTMFILIGTSNAVNLTDGLDGLASGVSSVIMGFFTVLAIKNGNSEMSIFGITIIGATLAFLLFNVYPAKMFLGDTGSLALGGAIAAIAIVMKMPVYLAIVAIIPVAETLSSALQVIYFRITNGKRLFKMAPLHHHLELSGMKETKIVPAFWSITIVACIIAYFI